MTDPTPEDVERGAEAVHEAYRETCARLFRAVRHDVPYSELSEDLKELDRATFRAALTAMPPAADHSALIRELRDALAASDRLLGRKSGLTPAGQMLAVRAGNEAALRKANEALGGNISTKGDENVYRD